MEHQKYSLRETVRHIIFGTDTRAGRFFDQTLIVLIILSVALIMIDSVPKHHQQFGDILYSIEWAFTIIFTIEYLVRIIVSKKPTRYIFSFYGFVDIISILPTYISLFVTGTNYLLIIRLLRVLRVFRVLKMLEYMGEARLLMTALQKSRKKIVVFMYSVGVLAIIFGSLMYVIEGSENGFTSIPRSIYWAIVTITTVGYGDISPATPFGQTLAAFAMLTGYAIIAIPTGIVTAEIATLSREMDLSIKQECPGCHKHQHSPQAKFCDRCGSALPETTETNIS